MDNKLNSRKFGLTVTGIVLVAILTYTGHVTSADFVRTIEVLIVGYGVVNAASKFGEGRKS